MKIWLINAHEPVPIEPYSNSRLFRTGSIAYWAAKMGHEVTWWSATFSHFRRGFYRKYNYESELIPGLILRMIHTEGYRKNVSLARLRHIDRLARGFARWARRCERPDVILCSFPPPQLALEAVRYGREYDVPTVLDIRDMWPDALHRIVPGPLRPLAEIALYPMAIQARKACAGATALIGITDEFLAWGLRMGRREKSDQDRTFPFSYAAEEPPLSSIQEAEGFWDRLGIRETDTVFTICFFGSMGRHLRLLEIIEAARILNQQGVPVRFVLCGTGDRLDAYRALAKDLPNVLFPGWVEAAQIRVLMKRSHAGIDPLPETVDFLSTINNKAVEYLSAGLPLLVSPERGVLYDLVRRYEVGVGYPAGDAAALARRIMHLIGNAELRAQMARNAARLYEEMFKPEIVYNGIVHYLEWIVESTRA